MPKKTRWKPKEGEKFYYVGGVGEVRWNEWYELLGSEKRYWKFGNCFKTRREAISARNKIKKLLLIPENRTSHMTHLEKIAEEFDKGKNNL